MIPPAAKPLPSPEPRRPARHPTETKTGTKTDTGYALCYDSGTVAVTIPLILAVIPILIALYALRVSLRAEKYGREQVQLMQEQETKRGREQASQDEWSAKFDAAVSAVQKLGPHWMVANGSQTNAYGLAFPAELVGRIERYLIEERSSRGIFRARHMDASQFRLPPVRDTITQVLDCANKFRQAWPDEANRLGL